MIYHYLKFKKKKESNVFHTIYTVEFKDKSMHQKAGTLGWIAYSKIDKHFGYVSNHVAYERRDKTLSKKVLLIAECNDELNHFLESLNAVIDL